MATDGMDGHGDAGFDLASHGDMGHGAVGFGEDHDGDGESKSGTAKFDSHLIGFLHFKPINWVSPDSGIPFTVHATGHFWNNGQTEVSIIPPLDGISKLRYFGCHILGHGTVANLAEQVSKIAESLKLTRICHRTPNFEPIDQDFGDTDTDTRDGVLEWDSWSISSEYTHRPAGYFPGAKALSRKWRQYWQFGIPDPNWCKTHWIKRHFVDNPTVFDRLAGTWLQVRFINWYYKDTGDEETRFEVGVMSQSIVDTDKTYGYRSQPFRSHQAAGRLLVERVSNVLRCAEPQNAAKVLRSIQIAKHHRSNELEPVVEPASTSEMEEVELEIPPRDS